MKIPWDRPYRDDVDLLAESVKSIVHPPLGRAPFGSMLGLLTRWSGDAAAKLQVIQGLVAEEGALGEAVAERYWVQVGPVVHDELTITFVEKDAITRLAQLAPE